MYAFDYSFNLSLGGLNMALIENVLLWNRTEMPTPLIVEEDVLYLNGPHSETAFGNGDFVSQHHDFGVKGGYTAIDGHSEVLYSKGVQYRSIDQNIFYKGSNEWIGHINSLEAWPRN